MYLMIRRLSFAVVAVSPAFILLAGSGGVIAPLGKYTSAERRHWSFLPRTNPEVPKFSQPSDRVWAMSPIDAFVLSRMRKEGLTHATRAGRAALIRRVTFDLTGLPAEPGEIDAFVRDSSPKAWDKVVERLLASTRYGEHWGRHWLDVVRFSETEGFE